MIFPIWGYQIKKTVSKKTTLNLVQFGWSWYRKHQLFVAIVFGQPLRLHRFETWQKTWFFKLTYFEISDSWHHCVRIFLVSFDESGAPSDWESKVSSTFSIQPLTLTSAIFLSTRMMMRLELINNLIWLFLFESAWMSSHRYFYVLTVQLLLLHNSTTVKI